ncbi:MAG: hypothetical protein JKY34_01290 [Kordiimonadaceae bacterium]|nr:hypothetical protein [Kordiimonadaceae bacterium]
MIDLEKLISSAESSAEAAKIVRAALRDVPQHMFEQAGKFEVHSGCETIDIEDMQGKYLHILDTLLTGC